MNYYERYISYCDRLRIPHKHRATPALYEKTVARINERTIGCGEGAINSVPSDGSIFNEPISPWQGPIVAELPLGDEASDDSPSDDSQQGAE